jgi:hypothetical protein
MLAPASPARGRGIRGVKIAWDGFMISWNDITGIGDTVVMLPAAAVIGGWLLAARAMRMALCWWLGHRHTLDRLRRH